ncbi:MAG: hypothetical protein HDR23_09870 [Lachnospiraceae bacterium]|nr:hypothetical protein [Lachnospiraceae bacterium]
MDILDIGISKGIEQGVKALIEICQEFNSSKKDTLMKLEQKFNISEEKAGEYLAKYWK